MSINRTLLSVSNSWQLIYSPSENNRYLADTSGTAVDVFLSDTALEGDNTPDMYFTIGGTISQVKASKDKYVYVKANIENDEEVFITTDVERIPINDVSYIRNELEAMVSEIMKLTDRVKETELYQVYHDSHHRVFKRKYLHQLALYDAILAKQSSKLMSFMATLVGYNNTISELSTKVSNDELHVDDLERLVLNTINTDGVIISKLSAKLLDLTARVLQAEKWIAEHRGEYEILRGALDNLETIGKLQAWKTTQLYANLNTLITKTSSIDDELKSLEDRVDRIEVDGTGSEDVVDLKYKVIKINNDLSNLNNTLVTLASGTTVEEIESLFEDLISTAPSDQKEVMESIETSLINAVKGRTIYDLYKDGTVVNTDDRYVVDPDEVLKNLDNVVDDPDDTAKNYLY